MFGDIVSAHSLLIASCASPTQGLWLRYPGFWDNKKLLSLYPLLCKVIALLPVILPSLSCSGDESKLVQQWNRSEAIYNLLVTELFKERPMSLLSGDFAIVSSLQTVKEFPNII